MCVCVCVYGCLFKSACTPSGFGAIHNQYDEDGGHATLISEETSFQTEMKELSWIMFRCIVNIYQERHRI